MTSEQGHRQGDYIIDVDGTRVRITQDGIFGIGCRISAAPSLAAHAVDYEKPFLSSTGHRSFLGYRPVIEPGMPPDRFATGVIREHIKRESKVKLCKIDKSYVDREVERRAQKPAHEPVL